MYPLGLRIFRILKSPWPYDQPPRPLMILADLCRSLRIGGAVCIGRLDDQLLCPMQATMASHVLLAGELTPFKTWFRHPSILEFAPTKEQHHEVDLSAL